MRHSARQAEYGAESKAVAGSEEDPIGDRARVDALIRQLEKPWWIAILVLAARISWARTASSGAICTGDINHRGSYAPIGSSASRGAPNRSRMWAKWSPKPVSPAK